MNRNPLALIVCSLLWTTPFVGAQEANPAEQRLREQLKSAMLQLRTAESERATLQAGQAERDATIKKLETQVQELGKQSVADKEASDKMIAKLKEEIEAKTADSKRLNDLLVKSEEVGKKTVELAKKTEEQRAKLAAQAIQLQRTVADQRTKNAKMFEIAMEVLSRYEKFGLGTALTAREPFVGTTRARLQSMVDEYDEKLSAQRIRIDGTSPKQTPAESKKPQPH